MLINSAEFAIKYALFRYHSDFTNAPKTLKDDQGIETPFNEDEFKRNIEKIFPKMEWPR